MIYSRALPCLERALCFAQAASLLVCASLVALCGAPASAQQGPATFTLSVEVAPPAAERPACWQLELLRERIAHYAAPHASYAGLRVEVQVEQPVVARLTLLRGDQTLARRRLTALPEACADRLDTLALAIAMALEHAPEAVMVKGDTPGALPAAAASTPHARAEAAASKPAAAAASDEVSASPAPGASAVSSAATPAEDTAQKHASEPSQRAAVQPPAAQRQTREDARLPSSSRREPRARAMHLRVGTGLLSNAAPSWVVAFNIGLELELSPAYSLVAAALVSNAAEQRLAGGAVEGRLLGGELRACRAWLIERLALGACLGAVAAACRAQGSGFPVRLPTTTTAWGAGLLRVELRWPQDAAISVALVLTAHANVVRPELGVMGSGARLTPGWFGGSGGLELVFRLL